MSRISINAYLTELEPPCILHFAFCPVYRGKRLPVHEACWYGGAHKKHKYLVANHGLWFDCMSETSNFFRVVVSYQYDWGNTKDSNSNCNTTDQCHGKNGNELCRFRKIRWNRTIRKETKATRLGHYMLSLGRHLSQGSRNCLISRHSSFSSSKNFQPWVIHSQLLILYLGISMLTLWLRWSF